jgi:hypothetical protein
MKPTKHPFIASCLALAITGSTHAAILLTDNFNGSTTGNDYVSATGYAADQGGTLGSVSYTVAGPGFWWNTQRGNGGGAVAYDNGRFSLNHDFATDANSYNQALQISFDAYASGFSNAVGWGSFAVGSSQNVFGFDAGSKFGFAFRQSKSAETYAFSGGTLNTVGDNSYSSFASDSFTILLTDTAGIGSAFNGSGSVAKLFVGGNLLSTTTLDQLGVGDGYLSFGGMPGAWGAGFGQANIDNLVVAVIPEPQAALLGGLGMLALLRRRR